MLWIAFKNLYLCDGEHQSPPTPLAGGSCELLSKICIFVTANIFTVFSLTVIALWIAFKNLYLCDGEHQYYIHPKSQGGCELLSKICIFVTANILTVAQLRTLFVVNCFQKFVSLWRRTSLVGMSATNSLLWIAFKNLYLCDGEHLVLDSAPSYSSCELLSKICIFVTANIPVRKWYDGKTVVNCFQKFVSLWRRTSRQSACRRVNELWIAFKNLYLCDGEHPLFPNRIWQEVVNCFQKFVSLWRRTSITATPIKLQQLWIAFKNLYLCDGEHRGKRTDNGEWVVNCFQKFVSLWRRTSTSACTYTAIQLWIAFKNLYLCDGEHPKNCS